VHVDADADTRLNVAVGLAQRHDAMLIGIAAGMWQLPIALAAPDLGGMSAEFIEASREQLHADLQRAGARFSGATERTGLKTDWRAVEDFPHAAICTAANAADLIVVGSLDPYELGSEYRSLNPGDVLMGAGRPLLVIPETIGELKARNIVAAWKNTREARRALADALPLLVGAESVALAHVKEESDDADTIKDAKSFLSRHGIEARVEIRELKASDVQDELLRFAEACGADLIVSGAYGRSQLREWVFGGVTRGLLKQQSVACQLSH
jgi:nucleotide-binding universal stress UspA family protein